MRASVLLAVLAPMAHQALHAAEPTPQPRASRRQSQILARALNVRPARREDHFRDENLRDEEVREIQSTLRSLSPASIINIGSVVTGCPCEDGGGCTDRVWVVLDTSPTAYGLQMSKIKDHWKLGPVQLWWIRYDTLRSQRSRYRSNASYRQAEDALLREFPACALKAEGS